MVLKYYLQFALQCIYRTRESQNSKHINTGLSTIFRYENFSARGVRGRSTTECKFGTSVISRKLLELESRDSKHNIRDEELV